MNGLQIVGAGKADLSQIRQAGANGNASNLWTIGERALPHSRQGVGEHHNLQIGAPGKRVCSQLHQSIAQVRLNKHVVLEGIGPYRLHLVEIQLREALTEGEGVTSDGFHTVRHGQAGNGRAAEGKCADFRQLRLRSKAQLLEVGQVGKGVICNRRDIRRNGVCAGGDQLRLCGGMAHQHGPIHAKQDIVHHPEAGISIGNEKMLQIGGGDEGRIQAGDACANRHLFQNRAALQNEIAHLCNAVREGQGGQGGLGESRSSDGLQSIVQVRLRNAGGHKSAPSDGHKAGRRGKGANGRTAQRVIPNGFQPGREFQHFNAAGCEGVVSDGLQCTGEVDVFQIATGVEYVGRQLRQPLRQMDGVEEIAAIERISANLPQAGR